MNGYVPKNVVKNPVTLDGDQTVVASEEFAITAVGSCYLVVKLVAVDVNVEGSITATLQTAEGQDGDWIDTKSASITADGNYYFKFLVDRAADQTYLPLLCKGRVVVVGTTDTIPADPDAIPDPILEVPGDAVTVSEIWVLQEL
jgi:hypothetical protein